MTDQNPEKELVVVYLSNNPMQAEEVRCLLEGSGLVAFVWDKHVITLNPVLGGPLGGVKVMVPRDQVDAVRDLFRETGRLRDDEPLPLTGDSFHPYTDAFKSSGERPAGDREKSAPRPPIVCASCGAQNEPDSVFCDQCARSLGA